MLISWNVNFLECYFLPPLINFDYNTHKLKELTFVFKWTSVTVVNYNMFLGLQLSIVRNGESTDIILKRNKKFKTSYYNFWWT